MLAADYATHSLIRTAQPTGLRNLPDPRQVSFSGLPPWSPVTTTDILIGLNLDRGPWGVWKSRGILPPPMPLSWFKATRGTASVYRADAVLAWIAARRGETYGVVESWRAHLAPVTGPDATDDQIGQLARMFAKSAGPVVGGVTFTKDGFQAYLASLTNS